MLQSPIIPIVSNNVAQDVKVKSLENEGHIPIYDVKLKQSDLECNSKNSIQKSLKLSSNTLITTEQKLLDKKKNDFTISRISSPSTTSISPPPTLSSLAIRNNSFSSSQQSIQSSQSDMFLDHSHLKPGENASLLSYDKTINMYRENAKKTNNMEIQCDFAIFLVEAAKRLQDGQDQQQNYIMEAEKLLKQVAVRGHSESQYYLANMYAAGLLNKSNCSDFEKAFPLFVQSAKHHHPDAAYRAAKCYEDGLGTKKDKSKAVQYYRKAGTLNHPGAMYRLGIAEMRGELGLSRNVRDGHKWLKRSAEAASAQYPQALHELGLLHEKGVNNIIFVDHPYSVSLYHEAAMLGYAPSAHRLGECYEFGKLDCKINPALSIQYYNIAAEQNYTESCFALTAWYLVGVPGLLDPSDEQAYAWALLAAQNGLSRAEYAVGYFSEMGIGTEKNETAAMEWYKKAADHGEKRAIQRLNPITSSSTSDTNSNSSSFINSKTNSNVKIKNKAKDKVGNNTNRRMSFISLSSKSQNKFFQRAASFLKK